jgi:hypothetical protein
METIPSRWVVINSRNCESIQVTLVAVQETGTMASSDKWQEWVEAGLLTGEQVTAISAYERDRGSEHGQSVPARSAFSTTVPEAIGYLGGLLALGGLIALLSRFWEDVNVAGRLGMTGGAAIVLGAAGALIAEDRAAAFTDCGPCCGPCRLLPQESLWALGPMSG